MNDQSKKLTHLSPAEKRALLAKLLHEKAQASSGWSPLSHGQKALWFLYRLAPTSAAYNLLYTARVRSALDKTALQRAVQELVRRYPILTAIYTVHDGEPMQCIHRSQIEVEEIDASAWNEEELKQRITEEGNRPFNLEAGILRIKVFTRSEHDSVLSLAIHHIAVDFWALDILVDELCILYLSEKVGVQAPLPSPGPQHDDYVKWQKEMLAGVEGAQHWSYWQQALAGDLPMLNLPTDRPRPPVQTYAGAAYHFPLNETVSQRLRTLAQAEKATPYMVLLAAFQILLYRYSHQDDILLGTTALGRNHADLERVIGYLANPVVLRAHFAGEPTFKEFLGQVRQAVIGALEHQDFPFPLLVERLQPKRDPSYSPLFQVLFIWDKMRTRKVQDYARLGSPKLAQMLAQEEFDLEPYLFGQQGAPFDVSLTIFELDGALSAEFHYNVDLFDHTTIERMGEHFQTLLEAIAADPEQRIHDLPLLTDKEQHQLLVEWNATERAYPENICVHQLFETQVERTPNAVAVKYENQILSYRELNQKANQLAHTLQAAGVGPDVLVGVCMERSIEMVLALLAVMKAGGAYVPLDPAYPQERLRYMMQDAQVAILLTQTQISERLSLDDDITMIYLDTFWEVQRSRPEENPVSMVKPENTLYMIYTSGSTGRPKGVPNTHRALCNRLCWMQQEYRLTPEDAVLQKTPFSFDVSVWEFFWPLLTGACLVIARPGGHHNPAYLVSLIADQQITTLHFVPSMLQAFLMEPNLERCKSLKRVFCSGEALTWELQDRFFSHFSYTELHNLYGPTEAAIDVTHWQCQRESKERMVPIGRPIANIQLYILDQAKSLVPIGVPGELYIGGVGVARGYFRRPELTAEKFVCNPFSAQEDARLFRTGDLVRYRADGVVEFLGRIDHQVKIRGFRIELGEVETVLGQYPGIKDVVVMAREDTPGNKRLVAYLVPDREHSDLQLKEEETATLLSPQTAAISLEELRTYLKEKLPDYMVPAVFLFLSTFPLLPNGKVNRQALPAPEIIRPELANTFVAPRSALEEQLAKIWTEVLTIDKVGIHDNFFDLGGASIQSLEVISKANAVDIPLTVEMLFEYQTIAELATALAAKASDPLVAEQKEMPAIALQRPVSIEPAPQTVSHSVQHEQGNSIIESLGVYLPPKVVTTDEIVQGCVKQIRFPLERMTGIKTRRMAGETEFSIDLAKKAIADCLTNSRYQPADIDMLVCGNISRCNRPGQKFDFEPSTAIQIQKHFGFTRAIVFDVDNACTGLLTAAYLVDAFLQAGLIRRGLVVSGEYITHLIRTAQKELENFMDSRLPCLTVGDAGAAMILERTPEKRFGFHAFEMYTLGRYSEDCIGKATDQAHGGAIMYTDAVRVSAVNMTQGVAHASHMIERSGWPYDSFQHIIIHQTSNTTIRDAARAINSHLGKEVCTQENVINNIAERANTATTTQMVAVMDHIRSGRIRTGDNAVFGITGSGATIGAALYTFDDLPDRIRRREAGLYTPEKFVAEQTETPLRLPAGRRIRVESIGVLSEARQGTKTALELAQDAAMSCLSASSYERGDIDLLMYAGVYRDEFLCEPAVASLVAGRLQINDDIASPQAKKTFALDVFNGALGTLNACYAAIGIMLADKARNALILAAEIENNRETMSEKLFGLEETASALLLDESPDRKTGFGNFVFKYFTEYLDAYVTHSMTYQGKTCLHIETDPNLETYYIHCIQETVQELLHLEHLDISQIRLVLPPQISSSFINALSDMLGIERDKLIDVQAQRDLFTSSLPYALHYAREHQLVRSGDIGLIISVGSGIQVGCATYYF